MTGHERFVASTRGRETDRIPLLSWPIPRDEANALVVPGADADDVWFRLHGAQGEGCAPFLQHDRNRFEEIADARPNVLFAVAPFDLGLIQELPAHVFAWSGDAPSAQAVRAVRSGAQASANPASEIRLIASAA